MEFELTCPDLPPFIARMRQAPEVVRSETTVTIKRLVFQGERVAKQKVRRDTADLQRSITGKVTSMAGTVTGVYGTNKPYAEVVEKGRGAGKAWPPPGALHGWMKRHGIPLGEKQKGAIYHENEFAVARKIGRKGIPAQPYMQPSADHVRQLLPRENADLARRIIAKLGAS